MEYMILLYSEEAAEGEGPMPGTPEFEAMMGEWMAYNQTLIDGGHYIGGGSLQPSTTATTIARNDDEFALTDGPFIESKEALGGYYIVSADNLDQAIELAKRVPITHGHFEVWPIAFRPDA